LAHIGDNVLVPLARHGFVEEAYYSWKFYPIIGEDGYAVGCYATVVESTKEVISSRRSSFLRQLSLQIAQAEDLSTFWPNLLEGLEKNETDIPVALLYSTEVDFGNNDKEADRGPRECLLKGTLGVPDGHVAAKTTITVENDDKGFAPAIRASLQSGDMVLLQTEDGSLDENLVSELRSRGFHCAPKQVIVCPIRTMASGILGFMILGLNPRKPFNSDYREFTDTLTKQIVLPCLSTILLAEEVRRTKKDRAMLSKEFIARTKAFERSEPKFLEFADRSPVAVVVIAPDGVVLYANEPWYNFSMVDPQKPEEKMAWLQNIVPEDQDLAKEWWRKVTEQKMTGSFTYRTRKPYVGYSASGTRMEAPFSTGFCTVYSTLDTEGNIETIRGIISNVSELKWIEDSLQARMEEALRVKSQQEAFIDMISHEIRNPMSAMLHCSEAIIASLNECLAGMNVDETANSTLSMSHIGRPKCNSKLLEEAMETAETIIHCIQHQRRVADDVLMLSKLDSDLLTVSPCPVQPKAMVFDALKILETEVQKADIVLKVVEGSSIHDLKADWVNLDPSRVLQVILNFLTNAIKFTRSEATRRIVVRISASLQKPSEGHHGTKYLPQRPKPTTRSTSDLTSIPSKIGSVSNNDDDVYLAFSVTDTGKGLSDSEMNTLFQRFAQATPKTSSVYGGSGLGLFISRQLAEMLGGAIGVSSESGKGATFAFFVKTRRTVEPQVKSVPDLHISPTVRVGLDSLASDTVAAMPAEEPRAEAEKPTTQTQASPEKPHVVNLLVVEDNLINQKVVSTQLRRQKYKVEVANHGVEALDALKKTTNAGGVGQNFDVVLMDLEMPVMGGLECVQNIRKLERDRLLAGHVPVIAVTANARSLHIDGAMQAGMDGVTTKPYRIRDLIGQIERARRM
jgi:signal transduction histidine kinase/CheY-like chemotaxis protein